MSSRKSGTTNSIAHSLKYLRELYRYEKETGLLISLIFRKPVGSADGNRGLHISLKLGGQRFKYYVHRLAVFLHTGKDPVGRVVFHRDGNNENNAWPNLALDDPANNVKNRVHVRKLGWQLGVTPVHKGESVKWLSRINFDGKAIHLGTYKTFEEAVAARIKAEIKYGYNLRHPL